VGWYQDRSGNHGFLFTDGNYTALDVFSDGLTMAWGINNKGLIVGYYGDNGSSTAHGFLAIPVSPVPLPGTLALFATGLGLLALVGWCRKRKSAPVAV
jgi:hypothetical protein